MVLVTNKGQINTDKDVVVFTFKNDDELNNFIKLLATSEVKTSGIRILPLIPPDMELNPLQTAILDVIEGMDGIGSEKQEVHEQIVDDATDKLKKIIGD